MSSSRSLSYRPYFYYISPTASPRLCEIDSSGFVYFADEERYSAHRSRYGGRFVKLVEDVTELAAQWPTLDDVAEAKEKPAC